MKKYGPSIVSYERFKKHCELHPEWAVEAWRISKVNGNEGKGARLRAKTHCDHGHPLSGTNISYEPNGRRKCLTCVRRRDLAPRPPSEEQIAQVTAALNAGKPLRLICQGMVGSQSGLPRITTFRKLKLYRSQNPAFDRFVISVTADSKCKAQQRRHDPHKFRMKTVRDETNDFHKIIGMMPTYLAPDIRNDIAQSIFLALFEGTLQRDQVKARVQQFVADHNRMFPTNFAKFGDARLVSLDEVMFDDGSTTRGDTVSRGLWD